MKPEEFEGEGVWVYTSHTFEARMTKDALGRYWLRVTEAAPDGAAAKHQIGLLSPRRWLSRFALRHGGEVVTMLQRADVIVEAGAEPAKQAEEAEAASAKSDAQQQQDFFRG